MGNAPQESIQAGSQEELKRKMERGKGRRDIKSGGCDDKKELTKTSLKKRIRTKMYMQDTGTKCNDGRQSTIDSRQQTSDIRHQTSDKSDAETEQQNVQQRQTGTT